MLPNTRTNISSLSFLLDSDERKETNFLKERYRKKYEQELPVLMEISSWEVIANLTAAGLGIGLFPDYVANKRKDQLQVVHSDLSADSLHYLCHFQKK